MEIEMWADPSLILAAALYVGVSVTKIRETPKQVRIESNGRTARIYRRTFENYTMEDLSKYLKRKLA